MARKGNRRICDNTEREEKITEALQAIKEGRFKSLGEVAEVTKFQGPLCGDRLGQQPRNHAHEAEQLLSYSEEKELARRISLSTVAGLSPIPDIVLEMVEEIRKRQVKGVGRRAEFGN